MAQFKKHANPSQSESLLRSPRWNLPTDTLILEDRRPQVCARSWKRGEGGGIFPRRQIMQPTDYVSRPEESNLKGFSGGMCAEQVDHDVTWWVSGKSPGRGRVRTLGAATSQTASCTAPTDAWQTRRARARVHESTSAATCIWNHMQMLWVHKTFSRSRSNEHFPSHARHCFSTESQHVAK